MAVQGATTSGTPRAGLTAGMYARIWSRTGEGTKVQPADQFKMDGRPTPRRIAVVGCGHVGLVMAAGFARLGHMVTGIDKSPELVVALRDHRVPFHEEGLRELVGTGLSSGRLCFTTSYQESVANAEFIFLAVDTPTTPGGGADLRNIRAAAHSKFVLSFRSRTTVPSTG